jgi:lipoprotein-anchoring transpeptidase ErfK/SrfK
MSWRWALITSTTLALALSSSDAVASPGRSDPPASAARSGAPLGPDVRVPSWTITATLVRPAPVLSSLGSRPTWVQPVRWHGARLTLPVLRTHGGWLRVRLPERPNGKSGWIPRADAVLARTPYVIVVDLAARHLELFRAGRLVLDAPAGVGRPQYPTPTGTFFVGLFAEAPSPAWGPFVLVTTAHSDAITDWESSGDALVAIHGPLGADAQIGTTGAAISHGCIRLHVRDLVRLRAVPSGSLVEVAAR